MVVVVKPHGRGSVSTDLRHILEEACSSVLIPTVVVEAWLL